MGRVRAEVAVRELPRQKVLRWRTSTRLTTTSISTPANTVFVLERVRPALMVCCSQSKGTWTWVAVASCCCRLAASELVAIGKQGMMYVVPYSASANNTMGGLDGPKGGYKGSNGSDPASTDCSTSTTLPSPGFIAQCFEAIAYDSDRGDFNGIRSTPAFWSAGSQNQFLYLAGLHDVLKAFSFNGTTFSTTAYTPDNDHTFVFNYPGAGISVSWDGTNSSSGVVWALATAGSGAIKYDHGKPTYIPSKPAVLFAFQATPNSDGHLVYLWDSSQLPHQETAMPGAVKFVMPTIADGRIFIAGGVPNYFGTTTKSCPAGTKSKCAGQLTILH